MTIYLATSFTSCANIVPPSGGPRDSIPPYRIKANPIDSAINVQPKEISIFFNEYINTTSLQENVLVFQMKAEAGIINPVAFLPNF